MLHVMQESRKMHGDVPTTVAEAKTLLSRLRGCGITQERISADTGIDQGHVSKLIRGDFKRLDGRALQLCEYANKAITSAAPTEIELREQIIRKALALWDHTEPSARRVVALLEAISAFSSGK